MGSSGSLRMRLLSATAVILLCALAVVGLGLVYLFEQHVERRIEAELKNHLIQLITLARMAPDGSLAVDSDLSDPRFLTPYSGLYWQIDSGKGVITTSRSLWDFELGIDTHLIEDHAVIEAGIPGPQQSDLIALVRRVSMKSGAVEQSIWFTVALDHGEVSSAVQEFALEIGLALGLVAMILFLATWAQVAYGLMPLQRLGTELAEIRRGIKRRFVMRQPQELAPFVAEMNGLLQQQEAVMDRSRARAGSLAHGLKTPMAAIGSEVETLRQHGEATAASRIDRQIHIMERHVQRELIRARVRASGHGVRSRSAAGHLARGVIETLRRLPRGEDIEWTVNIPDDVYIGLDEDDLAEILGNVLDNGRKWARSRVAVAIIETPEKTILTVEDDGPGVAEAEFSKVTQWGMRADESVSGSGLGLAIVHDILTDCGGSLSLYRSSLGGLGVRIEIPAAGAGAPAGDGESDEMLTAAVAGPSGTIG